MPATAALKSPWWKQANPATEATLLLQAVADPQLPPLRFTEKAVAPTEYSRRASPLDLTSAAIQPTVPEAVVTVTGEPRVIPLSVLSRTFRVSPSLST